MSNLLTSLWQSWRRTWSSAQIRPYSRPRTRLAIEALEDRFVPSVTTGWEAPGAGLSTVAADSSGNVYSFASGGALVKYSSTGVLQWSTPVTGTDIAVDSSGTNVYITGGKNSTTPFVEQLSANTGLVNWTRSTSLPIAYNGPVVTVDGTGSSIYVAGDTGVTKLDANNNVLWQARMSTSGSLLESTSIVTSGSSVFVAGRAAGTVTFVTASGTSSFSAPGECGFVVKLTSSDQYAWGESFGGNNGKYVGIVWDCNVGADSSGNVYAYGQFIGSVKFGGGTGKTALVLNGGDGSVNDGAAYVVKLNSAGTALWAKEFGYSTTSSNIIELPRPGIGSIAVDSSGNIYMTGYYSGTVSFNPAGGGTLSGGGGYVVKWDTNGNYQWAVNAGNTNNTALAVDGLGDVYLTDGDLWQLKQS
jgi:hypothetical protein